jgi:tRNA pseudouridine55 synthase
MIDSRDLKIIKHGWLNIDKPLEVSSARVVAVLRKLLNIKKIGHAGTLDPLATGVLPVAFGEATKTVRFVQDREKEYVFTLKFGEATDSYDAAGKVTETSLCRPTLDEIKAELKSFVGKIKQAPPIYSAIRVDGKRAYALARKGEIVSLPKREVNIESIHVESFDEARADVALKVLCGKGTYVRSIAHDLAKNLGSCGHVTSLRRTRVGMFDNKNIISLVKLEEMIHNDRLEEAVLPTWKVLDDILALSFSPEEGKKIVHGIAIQLPEQKALLNKDCVLAKVNGLPIGVGKIDGQYFKPTTNFNFN